MNLLGRLVQKARQDKGILAVFLFGSQAIQNGGPLSDLDICLVMNTNRCSPLELSQKKMEFLKVFPDIDLQIFQQLPLYIKKRILKEGKLIYCKDENMMYQEAFRFITEYNDYEHILKTYLYELEHA